MSCNQTLTVGDIAQVFDGPHATPKKIEAGPYFLSISSLENGKLDLSKSAHVSDEDFKKWTRRVTPEEGDILFSYETRLGEVAMMPAGVTACLGRRMGLLRPDRTKILPEYLLYAYQSPAFQETIRSKTIHGATVDRIALKELPSFPIQVPPILEQEKIVNVLKGYDRKLILNAEANKTLEQMAQAIFKSWFVDFDPVKAKMNGQLPEGMDEATASLFPEKLDSETGLPEGWKLSEIGDEVTVVGGGTPSKKSDDFWVDGHIHWTSPKDLSGVQDKVLLDTASKVTEAGLKKISSGLLPVDTVLLSSRAPVGYLALAKVPMAINQGYIAMKCEKQLPPEFVIQWCVHRMDEIKQRASGSTFAEISKKSFKPISVVVPSEDTLNAYQKIVKPLYDAITSNARQNEQLSSLRDTLLPKLLSGELSISD
ncbi:TPA: restriction endonuclease subunit S [Vibrio parahaemolyticus]|nr:restriction endonuclease subunit S [Vibrio parahaemolyticus]